MLFELDSTDGEWFQFFGSHIDDNGEVVYDDPDPSARVQVRSMKPFFEEKLKSRKRVVEHVLNPSTRQMERISYLEEIGPGESIKQMEDAYDYAITGLEGFKNKRDKSIIECTRENKIALMKNPAFDRFFAKCQALLETDAVVQAETEEKN